MRNIGEKTIKVACAIIGVILVIVAGRSALSRLGEPLAALSYDLPFASHIYSAGNADEIVIVYFKEHENGVILRDGQPAVLDALNKAGAKAVVYDLLFKSKNKVDELFAASIRRFRGVDENGEPVPGLEKRQVFLGYGRVSSEVLGRPVSKLIAPNDILYEAVGDHSPMLTAYPEDLYVARRLPTIVDDYDSLCWAVAASYRDELDFDSQEEVRWINYMGPAQPRFEDQASGAIPSFPAAAVVEGRVDPSLLRDKIVFIGGALEGVGEELGVDLFATPYHRLDQNNPYMSGVELQALMTSNLLAGNWLQRSAPAMDLRVISIAGLILGLFFTRLKPLAGLASAALLMLVIFGAGILTIHYQNLWFPWAVIALVQVPVALVWGSGSHYYVERFFRGRLEEEKRVMREAFQKYVSPPMLDQLTEAAFETPLGGETRQVAVMFTDIANFTGICEEVGNPEKVVESLNAYFEKTTKEVFDHEGVVIKFIGDAILAGWGAPVADPDSARKATRAALGVSRSSDLTMGGIVLHTRVGVHLGEVVAGNIGSSQHIDYTYIGDAVNLAARLESLNKMLGTDVLLSAEAAVGLGDEFVLRRVGKFRVKGKKEGTEVYELVGLKEEGSLAWLTTYEEALAKFEALEIEASRKLFEKVIEIRDGGDGPSRFLLAEIEKGSPGDVVTMTEK